MLEKRVESAFRVTDNVPHWRWLAACQEVDPELFYPDRGQTGKSAKKICQICPVRLNCLEEALSNPSEYGIWGGTSEEERAHIRRSGRESRINRNP